MQKYSLQIRLNEEDHAYLETYKKEHQLSSFSAAVAHILLERRVQESLLTAQLQKMQAEQHTLSIAAKCAADNTWLCLSLLNDQMATTTDTTHYRNDCVQLKEARQQLRTMLKAKQVCTYEKRREK